MSFDRQLEGHCDKFRMVTNACTVLFMLCACNIYRSHDIVTKHPKSYGLMVISYDAIPLVHFGGRITSGAQQGRDRPLLVVCYIHSCSLRSSRLQTGFHGHFIITNSDELGLVKRRRRKSARLIVPSRREVCTARKVGRLAEPSRQLFVPTRISTWCFRGIY